MRTIHGAADDIRDGRLSPVHLLDECFERIDRYESQVRAWVLIDRDGARRAAQRCAEEIKSGHWRGPLHGMPLAIKDIFDVFDWPTACGSKLWAQSVARRDATVVERLRRAGAVFLGKTVTTQYASFDPPVTRNPWDRSRTPGGSSSGSAAALACGMCLGALGSQTGGSIVRPAAYCGVAGLKPTYGRVSVDATMPLAASMDHPGPMAGCVRDLAILLQTIAGPDGRDPDASGQHVPDYLQVVEERKAVAPRLGRLRGLFESRAEPVMRSLLEDVAVRFRKQGAPLSEVALPAAFSDVVQRHRTVMAVEAAAYHAPRLERTPQDYEPRITSLLKEGLATPAPDYAACKEHQKQLKHDMLACFAAADILLTPATTGPAPSADTTGDPAFNSPWSYVGFPTVCLPAGWSAEGLPIEIQLIGRPWDEANLLAAAAWCEQVLACERREP